MSGLDWLMVAFGSWVGVSVMFGLMLGRLFGAMSK